MNAAEVQAHPDEAEPADSDSRRPCPSAVYFFRNAIIGRSATSRAARASAMGSFRLATSSSVRSRQRIAGVCGTGHAGRGAPGSSKRNAPALGHDDPTCPSSCSGRRCFSARRLAKAAKMPHGRSGLAFASRSDSEKFRDPSARSTPYARSDRGAPSRSPPHEFGCCWPVFVENGRP